MKLSGSWPFSVSGTGSAKDFLELEPGLTWNPGLAVKKINSINPIYQPAP